MHPDGQQKMEQLLGIILPVHNNDRYSDLLVDYLPKPGNNKFRLPASTLRNDKNNSKRANSSLRQNTSTYEQPVVAENPSTSSLSSITKRRPFGHPADDDTRRPHEDSENKRDEYRDMIERLQREQAERRRRLREAKEKQEEKEEEIRRQMEEKRREESEMARERKRKEILERM